MNAKGTKGISTLDLNGNTGEGTFDIVWTASYAARLTKAGGDLDSIRQTVGPNWSASQVAEDLVEKWRAGPSKHDVEQDSENLTKVLFHDDPVLFLGLKITGEIEIVPGFSAESGA